MLIHFILGLSLGKALCVGVAIIMNLSMVLFAWIEDRLTALASLARSLIRRN